MDQYRDPERRMRREANSRARGKNDVRTIFRSERYSARKRFERTRTGKTKFYQVLRLLFTYLPLGAAAKHSNVAAISTEATAQTGMEWAYRNSFYLLHSFFMHPLRY
jgi:hypothetical protein